MTDSTVVGVDEKVITSFDQNNLISFHKVIICKKTTYFPSSAE